MIRRITAALPFIASLAAPLWAEDSYSWGSQYFASTITLQHTSAPGAAAEVQFVNRTVHFDEDVTFTLDMDGMAVVVEASVGRGMTPDRMTVTPPMGFIAVPPEIDVPEDGIGVILIVPFLGY
jgi:hypothetical protein